MGQHENARVAVRKAVRTGVLIKPDVCDKCKRERDVTAHHYLGYDVEYYLDVLWLCWKCHMIGEVRPGTLQDLIKQKSSDMIRGGKL